VVCAAAVAAWVARGAAFAPIASYSSEVADSGRSGAEEVVEKVKLRLREFVAAPLSQSYRQVKWGVGLGVLALLVVPGLVANFRRHRGCAELYLAAYAVGITLFGGEGGHERYVVPVVPLLFYYVHESLAVLGAGLGAWVDRRRGRADGRLRTLVPRVLTAVVLLAVFGHAVRSRVEHKRGASPFSAESRAEAIEFRQAWEETATWAEHDIPEGTHVYAGSGGSWSLVHFFTERPVKACLIDDPPAAHVLQSMADWGAEFLLLDGRKRSKARMAPVLGEGSAYARLFHRLRSNDECRLYRIDRRRLAEIVARMKPPESPRP
jgi:hypothetical protein